MKNIKALAVLCGLSSAAPADAVTIANGVEFSGYWRAGFNTGANPTQRPDDLSGQGGIGDIAISRHIRNPSYFRVGLASTFENKMRAEFSFDSPGFGTFAHENNVWNGNGAFRTRDLFLQLPVGEESTIWAGSRRIEYEDVRLFDTFPFGLNAFGVGGDTPYGTWVLSANDSTPTPGSSVPEPKNKALTAMYRKEISLGDGKSIKPTLFVTHVGASPAQTYTDPSNATPQTTPEQKPITDVKGGFVYSYGGDGYWSNTFLSLETRSAYDAGVLKRNKIYSLYQSGSYNLGTDAAIVTALAFGLQSYASDQPVMKTESGTIVADGTKKTKSKMTASIGLQPVYYATDKFHIALDTNYAAHLTKVTANDSNALFVTPIFRYAMNKNSLGTPQIYTSITYGKYEAKVKSNFKGTEKTDSLITTQTGFEAWF